MSFKFLNSPPPLGPSVVNDIDGCQAGKNTVDAIGIAWISSCLLGVTGDWVIRAVVDCAEDCPADLNGDGAVDAADLAQLLGAWGMCP